MANILRLWASRKLSECEGLTARVPIIRCNQPWGVAIPDTSYARANNPWGYRIQWVQSVLATPDHLPFDFGFSLKKDLEVWHNSWDFQETVRNWIWTKTLWLMIGDINQQETATYCQMDQNDRCLLETARIRLSPDLFEILTISTCGASKRKHVFFEF